MTEPLRRRGRPTATSQFGVGRRENHDASDFYRRFSAPSVSPDDKICLPSRVDEIVLGDVRDHDDVLTPCSVALVVTSPPYYSGKEYEAAIGEGHVPASYQQYLDMLRGVFAACVEALEPGGRIAVNVANLGRKPYRSLSADVIAILESDLGLLLRGEIIWQKARGAAGNCAWGTFQRPGDPVLRDLTERVVVASKGRFDRAIPPAVRRAQGLPSESTLFRDEFLEASVDLWELPPERATRVGHPAPFPVELPQRLIDLYTYQGDLVLDPFMGSGTTAVAALRTGRRYLGFDTDAGYVAAAGERVGAERARLAHDRRGGTAGRPRLPAVPDPVPEGEDFVARAVREGRRVREVARWMLEEAGFTVVAENRRLDAGVAVELVAEDRAGRAWFFDVSGAFSATRAGLQRADALFRSLGKATVVHQLDPGARYVLVTTDKPARRSAGERALRAATGTGRTKPVYDVVALGEPDDFERLRRYARGGGPARR